MKFGRFRRRAHSVGRIVAGLLLCAAVCAPIAAWANDDDFYKGKTIDFLIGYGTGGGYDLYARLVAEFLGNQIPGNPRILPRNMPGAASRAAAAHIYNIAPHDGTVLGMIDPGLSLAQAMGENLSFDNTKFNWIGNVDQDPNVVLTWYTSGVTSLEEAQKKELTTGGILGSSSAQVPQLMNAILGTRFKIVVGYPSANDVNLAMEQGELQARGAAAWSVLKATEPEWLRDHKVNLLVQVGVKRAADLPDIPLLADFPAGDIDHAVLRLYSASIAVGRPIFTAPDVPPERVKMLRDAFDKMVKDPAFLEAARNQKANVNPMGGGELQSLVTEIAGAPKTVTARMASILDRSDLSKN